ncbi:MAG: hypothetical protein AVDCRST_MAG04-1899, partial [uncultured Acetobacteraceae bacterium]
GRRLEVPAAARPGAGPTAGADRVRRPHGRRNRGGVPGAGNLAPACLLPAPDRVHRLRAGARVRTQLLRVERRSPLLDHPRRRQGGGAGGLELPGPGARLRRHPRPLGGVRRRDGTVLRRRRGGDAAARRLLRRLDHAEPQRAIQGRPRQHGLV